MIIVYFFMKMLQCKSFLIKHDSFPLYKIFYFYLLILK